MATVKFKGTDVHTTGSLPKTGSKAPDFKLTTSALTDVSLVDYKGKTLILNIVPSLDTGVCATSAKTFNTKVKNAGNTLVLTVSRDLPFAQKRFCAAEGVDVVVPLSELRNNAFGTDYGVTLTDGPLAGLLSRAVVVVDPSGKVVYTEQVPDIGQEPDYEKALAAAKAATAGY
jgi:thioredoxin-dependent peroxiredoxin